MGLVPYYVQLPLGGMAIGGGVVVGSGVDGAIRVSGSRMGSLGLVSGLGGHGAFVPWVRQQAEMEEARPLGGRWGLGLRTGGRSTAGYLPGRLRRPGGASA